MKTIPSHVANEAAPVEHRGGTALNYAIRRPKGVLAVVCPLNAPFLLMSQLENVCVQL